MHNAPRKVYGGDVSSSVEKRELSEHIAPSFQF